MSSCVYGSHTCRSTTRSLSTTPTVAPHASSALHYARAQYHTFRSIIQRSVRDRIVCIDA
eukprot:1380895-Rhodomonas_salina.8